MPPQTRTGAAMNNSNHVCTDIRTGMTSSTTRQVSRKIVCAVRRVATPSIPRTVQCRVPWSIEAPALDRMRYAVVRTVDTTTPISTGSAVVPPMRVQVAIRLLPQTEPIAGTSICIAVGLRVGVAVDRSVRHHTQASVVQSVGIGTRGPAGRVAHRGVRTHPAHTARHRISQNVRHRAAATVHVAAYANVAQRIGVATVRTA